MQYMYNPLHINNNLSSRVIRLIASHFANIIAAANKTVVVLATLAGRLNYSWQQVTATLNTPHNLH